MLPPIILWDQKEVEHRRGEFYKGKRARKRQQRKGESGARRNLEVRATNKRRDVGLEWQDTREQTSSNFTLANLPNRLCPLGPTACSQKTETMSHVLTALLRHDLIIFYQELVLIPLP